MLRLLNPLIRERPRVEERGRRQDSEDRDARPGLYGIKTARLDALLAATVRGRHAHAAAVAFHLVTAGMLLRCHLGIGKGACHGWREEREKQCPYSGQVMQTIHPFLA